jgi:hypothetical protein
VKSPVLLVSTFFTANVAKSVCPLTLFLTEYARYGKHTILNLKTTFDCEGMLQVNTELE